MLDIIIDSNYIQIKQATKTKYGGRAMNEIRISKDIAQNTWMARFVDDAEIKSLFGTDTIPTAFTAAAAKETVIAQLIKLNPGYTVTEEA